MPLGALGGLAMARELVFAFTRQDFYLSPAITLQGWGIAVLAYLGAVVLAAALVAQRIWKLDLVSVLKTRE